MAELLVRIVDKVNPNDPYKDARCLKAGDVVCVCPDGHPWSEKERTSDQWTILKVPDLSMDEANALLAEEPRELQDPLKPRRTFRLDLANLKKDPKAADILSAKKRKPTPPDPNMIG